MTFLPDNYEKNENLNETSNRYMKFETGENRFRVLASAIVGWEWWEDKSDGSRTPKRVRIDEKIDVSGIKEPESIKRFWAFPVYNYKLQKIQILEITQKGIQATIRGLTNSEAWGSPTKYDISVMREGEGLETKYEVIPSPPKKLDEEIQKEFEGMYLNLDALFDGGDPFTDEREGERVAEEISENVD